MALAPANAAQAAGSIFHSLIPAINGRAIEGKAFKVRLAFHCHAIYGVDSYPKILWALAPSNAAEAAGSIFHSLIPAINGRAIEGKAFKVRLAFHCHAIYGVDSYPKILWALAPSKCG